MKQSNDEDLLAQYFAGDTGAFVALYERHKGPMYRYFLRHVQDGQIAEDLFQDLWSKIISHGDSFVADAKFSTWAYTIARNKLIDHGRHLQVRQNVFDQVVEQEVIEQTVHGKGVLPVEAYDELTRMRQKQAISACLEKLPSHLLDAFLLKEEGDMSGQQISEIINISYEATKSRLRYAYQQLRTCLQQKLKLHESLGEQL